MTLQYGWQKVIRPINLTLIQPTLNLIKPTRLKSRLVSGLIFLTRKNMR